MAVSMPATSLPLGIKSFEFFWLIAQEKSERMLEMELGAEIFSFPSMRNVLSPL
jgi:hypothetical protein